MNLAFIMLIHPFWSCSTQEHLCFLVFLDKKAEQRDKGWLCSKRSSGDHGGQKALPINEHITNNLELFSLRDCSRAAERLLSEVNSEPLEYRPLQEILVFELFVIQVLRPPPPQTYPYL